MTYLRPHSEENTCVPGYTLSGLRRKAEEPATGLQSREGPGNPQMRPQPRPSKDWRDHRAIKRQMEKLRHTRGILLPYHLFLYIHCVLP